MRRRAEAAGRSNRGARHRRDARSDQQYRGAWRGNGRPGGRRGGRGAGRGGGAAGGPGAGTGEPVIGGGGPRARGRERLEELGSDRFARTLTEEAAADYPRL